MERMTPGYAFKRAMQDEGLTQTDVVRHTGLGASTVHRWVTGKSDPPPRRVAEAMRKLGIDPTAYGVDDDDQLVGAAEVADRLDAIEAQLTRIEECCRDLHCTCHRCGPGPKAEPA